MGKLGQKVPAPKTARVVAAEPEDADVMMKKLTY
jgi:hypothetical protein